MWAGDVFRPVFARTRMKSGFLSALLVPLAIAAVGCHKEPSGPPVATPSVTLSHPRVPLGSPVEITYEFKVAPDAPPFKANYKVFVHFVSDADDELMWADDHYPDPPTTKWKAGETIKYNRLVFVPVYPYVGDASIDVGLYGPDNVRLPLSGQDRGQRAYRVAKIQMAPQTESVYVTFKDGWHLAEMAADNVTNEWHWTKKEATLSFKNPKRNSTFYLDYGAQPKDMTDPQTVTVSLGSQVLDTFPIGAFQTVRRIPISVSQLGTDDQLELKLTVDRTFVPFLMSNGKLADRRELGLCVFHAYIDAR
jgi:hypothetical protein